MDTLRTLPDEVSFAEGLGKKDEDFRSKASEAYFRIGEIVSKKLVQNIEDREWNTGSHLFPVKAINMKYPDDEFPAILVATYFYPNRTGRSSREERRFIPEMVLDLRSIERLGTYITVVDKYAIQSLMEEDDFRFEVFPDEMLADCPASVYIVKHPKTYSS